MVMNKRHQSISSTNQAIPEPPRHKTFKKNPQKSTEFRINSSPKFNSEVPENFPKIIIPEIHLNKLPPIPNQPNLHHSDSEVLKLSANINKNLLFTIENPPKDMQDLSNSFNKEEIRSKARKKMTEVPKKIGLLEHARKNTYIKTPVNMRHLPKVKKSPDYGNHFMELIINTYCKSKEQPAYKKGDFGLGTQVTNEEFYSIINALEDCSGSRTSRTVTKSALDCYSNSPSSSPVADDRLASNKPENVPKTSRVLLNKKENVKVIKRNPSAFQIASQSIINPRPQILKGKGK